MEDPARDIIALYQRHADAWARARDPRNEDHPLEAGWLTRFLAELPGHPPRVLDLGCGTGRPMAAFLAAQCCAVTGIDTSPGLIARAAHALPGHRWRVADMREVALGTAFDGILAWDSFFHLDHADQRRMFDVFSAHAAAGTALMFTSGPAHGIAMGTFEGEPLYHASLAGDEYRVLLDGHGFDVLAHVVDDPDCGHHTIWLARRR